MPKEVFVKYLALILLPIFAVFITMGVMAKLLSPNSTGLTNTEIEAIWLAKNAIEIETQFYSPPVSRVIYCGFRPSPPQPITFLADLPKPERVMYSPVNIEYSLCNINTVFCVNGI
jgi:hypothetical protein